MLAPPARTAGPRTSISPSYGNDRVETALELRGRRRVLSWAVAEGLPRSNPIGAERGPARPWAAHPPRREGGHRSARRSRGLAAGLETATLPWRAPRRGRPCSAAASRLEAQARLGPGGRELPGLLWPSGSLVRCRRRSRLATPLRGSEPVEVVRLVGCEAAFAGGTPWAGLKGGPAGRVVGSRVLARQPSRPGREQGECTAELPAVRGELVGQPAGPIGVRGCHDESVVFQLSKAGGEDVGRDAVDGVGRSPAAARAPRGLPPVTAAAPAAAARGRQQQAGWLNSTRATPSTRSSSPPRHARQRRRPQQRPG